MPTPFKNCLGEMVDLDWPELLPEFSDAEIWTKTFDSLGYALLYVEYLHAPWDVEQKKRIRELCCEVRNAWDYRRTDKQYWRGLLYRILDETENLC